MIYWLFSCSIFLEHKTRIRMNKTYNGSCPLARCHVIFVLNATARSHKRDVIDHKCLHCTLHMQSSKNALQLLYLCKGVLIFRHDGTWVRATDCLWINARMSGKTAVTGFYIYVYITRQCYHTGSSSQPSSGCSFRTHSPVHTHMWKLQKTPLFWSS